MKCDYDPKNLTCTVCGHVALRLPTFRECRPPQNPREARPERPREPQPEDFMAKARGLGDMTADALAAIGITKERVSQWLGRPCRCPERQAWLNEIGKVFGIGLPN